MARAKLGCLFDYLEENFTDGEEKAKIYPQCAWILGKACCGQADFGTAYHVCSQGISCLKENGVLTVMDKLLEVQGICLEKMGRGEEVRSVERVREAIAFLYSLTGSKEPETDMIFFLLTGGLKELLIDRELLKDIRLSLGLSQENLSEGICSWETLSRIENGKRKPNRKNLYQMYKKMGLDREKYYGFIQTDDFILYEKVSEEKRKWLKGDKEDSAVLFEKIAEKLDMNIPVNRQYIESYRLLMAIMNGNINEEKAIGEAEKILRYTMKDYKGKLYRAPFRGECTLLNRIALCLKRSGRIEEAIKLWEQILDKFGESKVADQHHAISKRIYPAHSRLA